MNHESDNFYAEMLLKQLPAAAGKAGTSAGGGRLVIATMREAGIPVDGVRMVDGSGLSSLDRLTADALVGVIEAGATDPSIRAAFIGSLAVAGVSGTLSRRLPALRGQVKGKTGTTDLACTLSGLIRDKVVFAVLENGSPVSSWAARVGPGPVRHDPRGATPGAATALACSSGYAREQRPQVGLAEDRHAGLLRLGRLRARALADDDAGRLLRDGVRDLRAERLERCPRLLAAVPLERARDHVLLPGQRAVRRQLLLTSNCSSGQSSATSAWFASSANHSTIASARSGPIPSHAITSSGSPPRAASTVAEVARE